MISGYLERFKAAAVGVVKRFDSWASTLVDVSGVLGRSSLVGNVEIVDWGTAELLYNFDGLVARTVDSVPKHALRRGFKAKTGDKALDARIKAEITHLGLVHRTRQVWTWARLYGGAALYLGLDDGLLPSQPVQLTLVRKLLWIKEVTARDLLPVEWDQDPRSPHFGAPLRYLLTRQGGNASSSVIVHASRLVRFEGVTPTPQRRLQLQGWGDSVIQRCISDLRQMRGAFAAAGLLVRQASQGVVSVKGLAEIAAGDAEETFRRRLGIMAEAMSVANILMLDSDGEEFDRVEVGQLGGVVETLDRFVNMWAAVTGAPVTVIMGQAPAGLNATGDSDIRNWYDELASERVTDIEPRLLWVLRIMCAAGEGPTGGVVPPELAIEWPSLWQPTDDEKAELDSKQATADKTRIESGVVRADEVRASRFGDGSTGDITLSDPPSAPGAPVVSADAEGAKQRSAEHDLVAKIQDRVAQRLMPRASGIAQIQRALGVDAAQAEQLLGPEYYTAPAVDHAAQLTAAQEEAAAARRSQQGAAAMLNRVLEHNRNGRLWRGIQRTTQDTRFDGHGVAIVLPLPADVAATVASPGGLLATDLHCTLAYLSPELLPGETLAAVRAVVAAWAASHAVIPGALQGSGRFWAPAEQPDPVFLVPSCPALASARETLVVALARAGVELISEHGWNPHVTLAYVPKGEPAPPSPGHPVDLTFTEVALWWGDARESFPLSAAPKVTGLPIEPLLSTGSPGVPGTTTT